MYGYQYSSKDYFLESGGKADVVVYSRDKPPGSVSAVYLALPTWISDRFLNNSKLHTVVTDMTGIFLEDNNRVD